MPDPQRHDDCGCGGSAVNAAAGQDLGENLPSLTELDTALDALDMLRGDQEGGANELELALLGRELDDLEASGPDAAFGERAVTLEDLVALADRFPGLKVTLSFQ